MSTLSWVYLSLEQLFPSQSIISLLSKPRIAKSNFATQCMSGYVWRHQLDRIIIALFVLGKTYVVEPIFLLNLYWQKKSTLTVLEWSHFCLHCLDRICPKSFIWLGNEKSWRNLDIKVWYIFVGLLLNFNSYHIFHAISLEQTWKLLETCISTLEKDCEFLLSLYITKVPICKTAEETTYSDINPLAARSFDWLI